MKIKSHYDIVVVGSGLGGLVSAIILAMEGYSVCVLEKNNQFGGNLQTFVRDKTIFDTGVHYIGGLGEGQNLYQYFKYINIIDDLKLKKLDDDGFDVITFDDDEKIYKHAQGYDNFINSLLEDFPEEETAIRTYTNKMQEICDKFPLYRLRHGNTYLNDSELLQESAKDYINSLTNNEKLRAVLGGTNYLYAGNENRTPLYVHALSVNSYIESAYRCVNGGSQITKLLVKRLKENGGDIFKYHDVKQLVCEDGKITSAVCENGNVVNGDKFISNVDPKITLNLVGDAHFKKSYVNRINAIESTVAAFSVYIVLKPKSFKYQNKNFYHFKDSKNIWGTLHYNQDSWPEGYMVSMGVKKDDDEYGDSITIMTYMHFDEVKPWADSFNTVAKKNERGLTYEKFKEEKAEKLLAEVEKKFPNIRDCIKETYTSTPLSYRDYIGCYNGSMYGYVKDVDKPLHSFISPRTRIKNLLFTGQCLNMHGILGVTVGAVVTCSELLGRDYLLDKILKANSKVDA